MANNYFRLVCFVVNICPEPLREFFIQLAKKDAGTSYTSLDAYLTRRKPDITQLNKKKIVRNDQFNLLFPGHGTAKESQWDVTLLVTLIINLFPTTIFPLEEFAMNEIRNIRNDLQHISNTANISNSDFSSYWGRLESAVTTLAHKVFGTPRQAIFKLKMDELKKLKKNQLPNLVECLRLWHEETVRQMAHQFQEMSDTVKDLKTKLNSVESNTSETASVLRHVTVLKPGPDGDGDKNKRFKSVDNILKQLQGSFESTIKELPDNFNAPGEVADIRTKLRDKHFVVVTGSYNSRYFESALAAVTGMDYNYKRCVEMQKSSDWCHIDPEDVDFVLCREPFGSIAYDDNKAKGMADIFNSMKYTSNGDRSGKRIDIMIVTDFTILTECRRSHDHDMLDEVVKVFDATTKERPADLTSVFGRVNNTNSSSQVTSNLRVLTDIFLRQYSSTSRQVNTDVLTEARNKFKANKAVVLTGPGRASAAVALASAYQSSQCLLLTESNDVKMIDFQNVCLAIIHEFAGKYLYEKSEVCKWYSMFDLLYSAVKAGLINLVVTCEKSKLDKCSVEISPHPLLKYRVDFLNRIMVVKQEAAEVEDGYNRSTDQLQVQTTVRTSLNTSNAALNSGHTVMSAVPFQNHYQNSGGAALEVFSGQNTNGNEVTTPGARQFQLSGMHPLSVHSSHVQGVMTYNIPGHNSDPSQDFVSPVLQHAYNPSQQGQSTPSAPPGKSPNKIPITYAPGILHPSPPPPTLEHPLAILRTSNGTDVRSNSATSKPNADTVPGHDESTEILDLSVARVSNSIAISARSSTRPHVWSVKTNVKKSIKISGDKFKCQICGCCQLPSGEILLADWNNSRLKKLDARYQVIGVCDLPASARDVCYIGNNEAVVCLRNKKLQFVDVAGMTLTRSVGTEHVCIGLVCHGIQLYVTDWTTVCMYSTDGIKQRVLYTHPPTTSPFRYIAVSDDGSKIYITYGDKLITIDSSGNHLYTFTDTEHRDACGVCVDGEGHILVCNWDSGSILQFSSDGKHKLGTIAKMSKYCPQSLCFDRVNSCVIEAGRSNYFNVLQLL